jgi:hypothetical protein
VDTHAEDSYIMSLTPEGEIKDSIREKFGDVVTDENIQRGLSVQVC